MKHAYLFILTAALLTFASSCKKEDAPMLAAPVAEIAVPLDSTASYRMVLTGTWAMPDHTVPAGNHFTKFIGIAHNNTGSLFHPGSLATKGVENVAEVGSGTELLNEIAGYIDAGRALNKFSLTLPTITAADSTVIYLTSKNSLISFVSMIAPSPDWFAGLDSYNLVQNGKWVSEITIKIYGYDAGTEEGDVFGYSNPDTSPQQAISLLSPSNASVIANGHATVAPFATLHLTRQ